LATGTSSSNCVDDRGTISISISRPGSYTYQLNTAISGNFVTTVANEVYRIENVAAGFYDVTIEDNGGGCCTFDIFNVEVPQGMSYDAIAAPSATTPQTFCHGATVANLQTHNGINIVWYDQEIGGTAYLPSDGLNDGVIYYAEQNIDGCERERTAVKVFIDDDVFIDAPNMPGLLDICLPATLADVPTYGNTNLVWYDVPVGGTPLDPSAIDLVDDISYWVALDGGTDCNGDQRRTEVMITIAGDMPVAPTMNTPQHFCEDILIGNIETPNDQIVWYKTATGGVPLSVTDRPVSGIYYAAQKTGSCESTLRTSVEVIIDHYPPPVTMPNQCYVLGLTLGDLTITGAGIKWYIDETDDTPQPLSTVINIADEYWVTQSSGLCESERVKITIVLGCNDPCGTVFPFVYTEDPVYNAQFETTVKLYAMPPETIFDKIGYVRKQIHVHATVVSYYDCVVDFIEGVPKEPGLIGRTDNPGKPIRWDAIGYTIPGYSSPTLTDPSDCPTTSNIGKYRFLGVAPGEYVIEIIRKGYLTRYGTVEVEGSNYLGHREILAGDVNGDLMITEKDLSTIRTKITNYGSALYNPAYDLRGTRGISSGDVGIISFNLGAYTDIYQETKDWIDP